MAAINGFRYPLLTDNPDIPEDMAFLATDVITRLARVVLDVASLNALAGATMGDRAYVTSAKSEAVHNGAAWVGHADDWVTPAVLGSSWVPCTETGGTANPYPPQYQLRDGAVHIRGFAKSGTAANGAVIFTLPAGMRPRRRKLILVTAGTGQARVDITPAGELMILAYVNGGTNAVVSFDIHYIPEQ